MREFENMPGSIGLLPRDERGYPIPWFVATINGKADFRVADGRKLARAVKETLCWVCGVGLSARKTHVVGPMCVVNRATSEPPLHWQCAEFSARYCPFLSLPDAKRREHALPADASAAGNMIRRNPGVTTLWEFRGSVQPFEDGRGGVLFRLPEPPSRVAWWREGRLATRAEVVESIDSGLPILREMAVREGPDAIASLINARTQAEVYFPQ